MILTTNDRVIGGEQELKSDGCYYGVTNSGRSSLRWAIHSMSLQEKIVLVPDFVCQIVVDVLLELDIKVRFYQVRDDLEIILPKEQQDISAIYLVKYFGHESYSFNKLIENSKVPLIIDDVFGVDMPKIVAQVQWCYFNSFRKITAVADFSQLISNEPLAKLDQERLTKFSVLKYQAKSEKYLYLETFLGKESGYLSLFSEAENLLDECSGVYEPEAKSVFMACQFYKHYLDEQKARVDNLKTAKAALKTEQFINITSQFPSFLPLVLVNRDKIRKALAEHSIFLAIHWPKIKQSPSRLPERILSLPLDGRYTKEDIEHICTLIRALDT